MPTALTLALALLLAACSDGSSRETQHQTRDASTPARLATHTHDVHQLADAGDHLVEVLDAGDELQDAGEVLDAGDELQDAGEVLDAGDGSVDAGDAGKPKPPPPECMPAFFCQ